MSALQLAITVLGILGVGSVGFALGFQTGKQSEATRIFDTHIPAAYMKGFRDSAHWLLQNPDEFDDEVERACKEQLTEWLNDE